MRSASTLVAPKYKDHPIANRACRRFQNSRGAADGTSTAPAPGVLSRHGARSRQRPRDHTCSTLLLDCPRYGYHACRIRRSVRLHDGTPGVYPAARGGPRSPVRYFRQRQGYLRPCESADAGGIEPESSYQSQRGHATTHKAMFWSERVAGTAHIAHRTATSPP